MEIIIAAHKMELTDALKEHIEKRLKRVSRFSDKFYQAEVHLNKEKYRNHIHINIKGSHKPLMAEADDNESMYRAVESGVDKLEKQLRRGKDDHSVEKTEKEHSKEHNLE